MEIFMARGMKKRAKKNNSKMMMGNKMTMVKKPVKKVKKTKKLV